MFSSSVTFAAVAAAVMGAWDRAEEDSEGGECRQLLELADAAAGMKVGSSAIACSLEAAEAADDDVYVAEERDRCELGPWLFVPPLPSNMAASDTGGRFEPLLLKGVAVGACCALAPIKREEGAICSSNSSEAAAVAAAAWLDRAAGRRAAAAAAAASWERHNGGGG